MDIDIDQRFMCMYVLGACRLKVKNEWGIPDPVYFLPKEEFKQLLDNKICN